MTARTYALTIGSSVLLVQTYVPSIQDNRPNVAACAEIWVVGCKGAVDAEKKNTTIIFEVVFAGLFSSKLIVSLPNRPELSRTTPG